MNYLANACEPEKALPIPADVILVKTMERIDYLNQRLDSLNKEREHLSRAVEEMLQERDILCVARDALAPKQVIGNIPAFQGAATLKGY